MTTWLLIAALTISSSIDNLGVGLSYGIRQIRIRILSNLLMAAICFVFSLSGIYFGLWVSDILPGIIPVLLGVFILIVFGLRILLLTVPRSPSPAENSSTPPPPRSLKDILKNPASVDFDRSMSIGLWEAVILGIALSANALTNGIGAGLLGLSPLIISLLAAIGGFVTVWFGVTFGMKLSHIRIGKYSVGQFGTVISGVLLLLIACSLLLEM
ncbi:sporulation membrane protein YtaF [Paenibacillus paeoniae]|uniref:Sporulation membrane protein YtaF n=1 Tax=Paenibacillus paeoniae TaxID=2292705 RepID=A0A371P7S0_9BACL|nr:sporulation membrane protein YtaF [Paenibacillus paeoniae]REK71506.1 sporulation membrane protein YtaF [Paenibacillus paeoniae]